MASSMSPEDDVFDRLKRNVDPKVVQAREDAVRGRVRAQYDRAQRTLAKLIDENSTLPVSISEIRIEGARHTRKGFLEKVVAPALSSRREGSYTLASALEELHGRTNVLHQFGIFHPSIAIYLDNTVSSTPTKTDLRALLTVSEMSRFMLKTGTDLGSTEGTGYINGTYRNVFGGAESLNASASVGTRTRSAFDSNFQTPIAANPDIIAEAGVYASSRSHKHLASYAEALKGGRLGVKWRNGSDVHEAGFAGVWRQVTELSENASVSVRADAGNSVKNALNYTFIRDRRDNPLVPRSGYLYKHSSELAGWAGLGGDVAFARTEIEAQGATMIPGTSISVTAGLRGGLLYPLSLGLGDAKTAPKPSRINDRFQLGGPTDVRGFREHGLGAKDGEDSVGGDVYLAGGASILFPLPRLSADKPLRVQAFVNGGRLVGLQGIGGAETGSGVNVGVANAVRMMTRQLPSIAVGVGVMYAHPVARFELNFCLPIVARQDEGSRKGLQFGVGMNYL